MICHANLHCWSHADAHSDTPSHTAHTDHSDAHGDQPESHRTEVTPYRRVGVCDVHDLVDGDCGLRPITFEGNAWVCEECRYDPQKRARALLIRARLLEAQACPPDELLEAVRTRNISPEDEVLLWLAAFGPPDDE